MTVRPWMAVSALGTSALLYYAYSCISDQIDRDSSLMKQTMHNLSHIKPLRAHTGGECSVASRIVGEMLQRKGLADVTFDVNCQRGPFTVHLTAHRRGMNWLTDQITLFQNGQECCMINDINSL